MRSGSPLPSADEPGAATTGAVAGPRRAATGWLLPLLVLGAGGCLTAWVYVLVQGAAIRRDEEFFGERVAEAQAAINVRMTHYLDALHGGASFFNASASLEGAKWHVYAESLQLRKRYPGINGLGVILAVPPSRLDAWLARVRVAGEPDPEIKPFPGTQPGPADDIKYLITFIEGNAMDRPPVGRNIATDPSRRQAAELARDTGLPQINRRIPGSRDTQRRSGLLLYVPLYEQGRELTTVAERRAAHVGWVYAQVYPDVFLDGALGLLGDMLWLHFFEAGGRERENLLYASAGMNEGPVPAFERVTEMTLAGQVFQLGWQRGPEFPATERSPAVWVAVSTGFATLLLAGLVTSLQSVGRRANAIARTRTAELAASEERLRHAFEFAGIGMALMGLDGRLLRVNPALCEIVGYSEGKLLQKRFQEVTHPDDVAADVALLQQLVEGRRRSYQLEKRCLHRDGQNVWVRLTVSLVRDVQGVPLHAVAQVEDITERKRLEDNLATARDRAMEDSRLKSEFLATMIQEIRAPTNDVIQTTALLRQTALAAAQADYVRTLEFSGEALQTIINDILDYSKIEAGEIALEIAPFDLRQSVNGALALFAERASAKQLKLEAMVASRVPLRAAGDERRLRHILVNLLSNAIKFTQAGEVRLNLTAEALDATTGRQRLKFAVRDTGIGIAAHDMGRLFQSFSRVDAPTRRLGGTGLGLAISKRLAELMGGTMWAESEPGRGSTFHFTIVVEPRDSPAMPPPAAE